MTRRRTWWCTDRSLSVVALPAESARHTYIRSGLNHTSASRMHPFRLSGAVFISYSSGQNRLSHSPHETDPSFDFGREVSVFVDSAAEVCCKNRTVGLYLLWPAAASIASIEVRVSCNVLFFVCFICMHIRTRGASSRRPADARPRLRARPYIIMAKKGVRKAKEGEKGTEKYRYLITTNTYVPVPQNYDTNPHGLRLWLHARFKGRHARM